MKINKRTAIYFGIFFVLLLMTIGNAAAVQADGIRTRIISNGADQTSLDIQGDRIVWADDRNEAGQTYYWDPIGNWDIYMYDLSSSRETQITGNNATQLNPMISGNKIVWQDNRNGNWDIYTYDLSTSKENRITTNESNQTEPSISGDKIVWQDDRNGNWDIYMYDISDSTETRLSTNESNQTEPAIYGDKIIWVDEVRIDDLEVLAGSYRSFYNDICLYNLSTSNETKVAEGIRMWNPSIYGVNLVWEEESATGNDNMVMMYNLTTSTGNLVAYERTGDPDIYEDRIVWTQDLWDFRNHVFMYNISTSTKTEITADGVHEKASGTYPAINGDRIVWVQNGINVFTLATPGSPGNYSNKEVGTETQITINKSRQCSPKIYGDRIVWKDWRNGDYWDEDIYQYSVYTHSEIPIAINRTGQKTIAFYGDRIVWTERAKEGIYAYNISTSNTTRISNSSSINVAIYADRIFWTDVYDDLFMYNLSTSTESMIMASERAPETPAIYGDRIVWTDSRNEGSDETGISDGNLDVYMYDLSTKKETRITTNNSTQQYPAIYKDRIVWEDKRNGNWDIYMYNITTAKETQITDNKLDQGFPDIYGDRIVWVDDRSGRRDIYMYNLSTSRETRITTNGSVGYSEFFVDSEQFYGLGPVINGNRIVWEDVRNGNGDIYMFTFPGSEPTPVPVPPVANFSASPLSGKAPLKVKFTSTSTGSPNEWKWNFGDGSDIIDGTTSMYQNPEHTYSTPGIYTVKHTAINAYGRDTAIKTNYIRVEAVPPKAAFSASPTSGYAPLKITFTDKSTGSPTSWKWSFGDGTYSTTKNPVHTFDKAGKYTVSLTVKNAAGSNTITQSSLIVVNVLKAPVAAFSAAPTSGKVPLKVQFTDKSTGSPTSWKWSFGDGTYSTEKNPAHTYSKAGKYTVALTAKNAKGSSTKTTSGYIVVSKK